jgi:hypothetical protein
MWRPSERWRSGVGRRVRISFAPAKSPLRTCFEQPTTHRHSIALPFDSPLRRKLDIALVDTTRSSWWRELIRRYPRAE